MEFIKQFKCAGGNRNCILQNAEYILLQCFLPDLKTSLKTEEKSDVIKLALQKRFAGPHMETPREGLAWALHGEEDHGAMHSFSITQKHRRIFPPEGILRVRKSSTGSHCSLSFLAEVAVQK